MNNLVCKDRQYRRPGLVRLLFEFVFPHYCKVCGRRLDPTEEELCISCFLGMPRLDYDMNAINPTERMLLTERSLVRAASILNYSKESDYRNILFHLKYWHHPKVGRWLARVGAMPLAGQGFFEGIDFIVPLPLTFWKVIPEKKHSKQAGLGKYQRWKNAQNLFKVVRPELLAGKHILVVDDVITTGATLCSLIDAIQEAVPDIRVSVFTLAIAT